jgi:hypothetical protein
LDLADPYICFQLPLRMSLFMSRTSP